MSSNRILQPIILTTLALAFTLCPLLSARTSQSSSGQDASPAPEENPLVIVTESQLPDTYPHGKYQVRLVVHGGIPGFRWHVEKGALPPGIKLDPNGVISGSAEHSGEFQFTLSVTDNRGPSRAVQKQFVIRVRSAFNLVWKIPPHVDGNRLDGSVEVSNITPDDIDLTFIVMAVAGNGRATAIGYQHFPLTRGTTEMELPFGDTLPPGGYVVHVDVVGEVAAKNLIYRERMQTPGPLQVTVGP
jgi:hypothetical protein